MERYRDCFQLDKGYINFEELFHDPGFSKAFGEERARNVNPVIDFLAGRINLEAASFLDIGAGYGSLSIPLSMRGAKAVAGDISQYCLKAIQYRCEKINMNNIHTVRIDAFNSPSLPFKSSIFDLVLLNGIIEYAGLSVAKTPEDAQIMVLKDTHRVLKKGGYLYLATENRFAANYFFSRGHDGLYFSSLIPRNMAKIYSRFVKGSDYFMREFSYFRLKRYLEKAGYKRIEYYGGIRSYNNPKKIMKLGNSKEVALWGRKLINRQFSRFGLTVLLRLGLQKYFWPHFIVLCRK